VYTRSLDPSFLTFSLSLYRHPLTYIFSLPSLPLDLPLIIKKISQVPFRSVILSTLPDSYVDLWYYVYIPHTSEHTPEHVHTNLGTCWEIIQRKHCHLLHPCIPWFRGTTLIQSWTVTSISFSLHQKKILIINLTVSSKLDIWKTDIFTRNLISSKPYPICGKLKIIWSKHIFF
jgi:hypothetical protein